MVYPKAYVSFLTHFHGDRDYFECHEILEEYWKDVAPRKKDSHWVGLIQIAVSLYHHRRGNFTGASKTLDKAISILKDKEREITNLGLSYSSLIGSLEGNKQRISLQLPYESMNLPLNDQRLVRECRKLCEDGGFGWCAVSDLNNPQLVNRHTLRDRSEVINERNRILSQRNKQ